MQFLEDQLAMYLSKPDSHPSVRVVGMSLKNVNVTASGSGSGLPIEDIKKDTIVEKTEIEEMDEEEEEVLLNNENEINEENVEEPLGTLSNVQIDTADGMYLFTFL